MKTYVGPANTTPLSRVPRRLTSVITASTPRQSHTVNGCNDGTAEVSAPMPAEMPTATLSI